MWAARKCQDMHATDGGGNGVQSDETLFRILDVLKERDRAGVTEIASAVGVANSTVHRHLTSLQDHEFVRQVDGDYQLGYRFLDYGGYVRARDDLVRAIRPRVRQLAERTGEVAQFILEEHGRGVYAYRERGENAVQTKARIGRRFPLHTGSSGKAILAALPDERVREIIDRHGLTAKTGETVTDEEALVAELETVREEGVAFNTGENIEGVWAVGAPVRRPNGDVLGAISVAGPIHRMQNEWVQEELPDLLLGTINEFEITTKYS